MEPLVDRRNPGFHFDRSINFGNIIAIAALLFALWQLNNNLVVRLISIESKVNLMWDNFQLRPRP